MAKGFDVEIVLVGGPHDGRTMVIPQDLFQSGYLQIPEQTGWPVYTTYMTLRPVAESFSRRIYRRTGEITAAGDYVFRLDDGRGPRMSDEEICRRFLGDR